MSKRPRTTKSPALTRYQAALGRTCQIAGLGCERRELNTRSGAVASRQEWWHCRKQSEAARVLTMPKAKAKPKAKSKPKPQAKPKAQANPVRRLDPLCG